MRLQSSARITRSRMMGLANRESSHVLWITIVLWPPSRISEVYSSIARLLSPKENQALVGSLHLYSLYSSGRWCDRIWKIHCFWGIYCLHLHGRRQRLEIFSTLKVETGDFVRVNSLWTPITFCLRYFLWSECLLRSAIKHIFDSKVTWAQQLMRVNEIYMHTIAHE
jgi:hypothetical protein